MSRGKANRGWDGPSQSEGEAAEGVRRSRGSVPEGVGASWPGIWFALPRYWRRIVPDMVAYTALAALVLACIHLLAGKLRFLHRTPRSRWLSFAGGAAVAYVFLHILPDLAEAQDAVEESPVLGYLSHHIYLVAMVGLGTFYGLERAAKASRQRGEPGGEDRPSERVFWLHMASYSLYNMLIAYLLVHRGHPGLWALVIYVGAVGFHFLTNDYGLREDHKEAYERNGRWMLAAAVGVGWVSGLIVELPESVIESLFAFLAGGILLNVLKEELPEDRQARFGAFVLGCLFYTVLLLGHAWLISGEGE